MQNVEYKCELRDPEIARAVLQRIGGRRVNSVRQDDVYFKMFEGRLKKRKAEGEPLEWIQYHRQDRLGSKLCHFKIMSESEARLRFGERPMPEWVRVGKTRELWMYGSARVHIDEVDNLGMFFEIEALVTPRQHIGRCHRLIRSLLTRFGPTLGEPIACSYGDMMAIEEETAA